MLELRQGPNPINKRRRSKTEPPPRPGVSLPPHKPHRSRDPRRAGLPTPSQSTGGGVPPSPEGTTRGLPHPGAVSPGLLGTRLSPGVSLQVTLHTGLPVPEFYASRSAMQ